MEQRGRKRDHVLWVVAEGMGGGQNTSTGLRDTPCLDMIPLMDRGTTL